MIYSKLHSIIESYEHSKEKKCARKGEMNTRGAIFRNRVDGQGLIEDDN